MVAGYNQSRHVESIAQALSASLDERLALPLARLACHWGETCKTGGLLALQRPDLGTFNEDRNGGDFADAGVER